jgi:hypothetical protein
LECAFDEAAGAFVEPCAVCGGPSRDAEHMIRLGRLEDVPLCPACGGFADHDGQTLLRIDREGRIMPVIILRGME